MILEDATHEAYGYYPSDLSPKSGKYVLAVCSECCEVRITSKHCYHILCDSCVKIGRKHTVETKRKISKAQKGRTHIVTDEHKHNLSKSHIGLQTRDKHWNWQGGPVERKCNFCDKMFYVPHSRIKAGHENYCCVTCKIEAQKEKNSPNWKGGKKKYIARKNAKRRSLGFIPINTPFEGAHGHHVTHNSICFIPVWQHQTIRHNLHNGKNMLKINTLALDFLVRGI